MAPPCAALAVPSRFSSVTSRPTSCSTFIERESCGTAAVCAGGEERKQRGGAAKPPGSRLSVGVRVVLG
jgi:hypothetical protein